VPTVGIKGVGIMNSTAFSLLANSSAGTNRNQETELTIGSLSILIGPSGSTRLTDPTKPDPSASKLETVAMMESSEGSSSEVNSPVSLEEAQVAEVDEIQEKLDTEVKAVKTHNSTRDFAAESSGVSKRVHQLCIIITEAEEENNNEGNEGVDRQVDKIKEHNKKEKEKIHVSAGEWRIIMSAINLGTEVPEGARREVLMGYQYTLHQHKKKLREERDMLIEFLREHWEIFAWCPSDMPGVPRGTRRARTKCRS
jgi:hypothetical protein